MEREDCFGCEPVSLHDGCGRRFPAAGQQRQEICNPVVVAQVCQFAREPALCLALNNHEEHRRQHQTEHMPLSTVVPNGRLDSAS
ncbi:MAG: hypothetical protein ACU83N_11045 [Gammaproteobacteria bacterium]